MSVYVVVVRAIQHCSYKAWILGSVQGLFSRPTVQAFGGMHLLKALAIRDLVERPSAGTGP